MDEAYKAAAILQSQETFAAQANLILINKAHSDTKHYASHDNMSKVQVLGVVPISLSQSQI